MNPRAPQKRNICRYFASGGSCFYGDSCQFQHVLDSSVVPPGMPVPGGPPGPPSRSQSAGTPMIRPPGGGRHVNVPPAEHLKQRTEQAPFPSRSAPQRPTSYRSHHASNPPKHRMGGGAGRGLGMGGMTRPSNPGKPPSQKRDKEKAKGSLPLGDAAGGVTTLQPPPPSKQAAKARAQSLVQSGGTTYYYSGQQPSYASDYTSYTKPPSHLAQRNPRHLASGYFLSEDLRQELYQQQLACLTLPASENDCPKEVDGYHSLCPLEPVDSTSPDQESKRTFGHPSTCYRAINQKDGLYFCLRRIHGFRLMSAKAVQELDKWRQLDHVNLVSLRKMFTTKAFGDHSVVLVYDYHPAATTLKDTHLKHSKRTSPLPEDLVWDYVVQLASALRLVHGNHLALRCLDPSKVLVTGQHRLRINCAGIVDILTFDAAAPSPSPSMHQQGDLFSLGQLLLCVGLQSAEAGRPETLHRSMDVVANTYSPDLNHLLQYLLHSGSKGSPHSVLEVMSMLGAHVHRSVERALQREDILEMELSKQLQNGRLFRILAKLGTINERPEFAGDEQWSETGDRYLLKLFRDHLFHQVLPSGSPWVNLAHIVQTLNKVDAGSYENVALHSRDEQSVLVVSYADLKTCLEKTFSEVLSSSGQSSSSSSSFPPSGAQTKGEARHVMNGHMHATYKYTDTNS